MSNHNNYYLCISAEPIRIYYGTNDETEIYNETTINVTDTNALLRIKFVGDERIGELLRNTSNLVTSYHTVIQQRSSVTEPMSDTHFLRVTESGSLMVQGLQYLTGNTDYTIILYFDGTQVK